MPHAPRAYYNEFDPYAAQWLRNLIAAGHIAPGDVDERSIVDVRPDDLRGYTQCHFFAGIGGWSLAARLAGWPDHRPLWTGSCPCQPFSAAGKRKGTADERHLWPEFYRLIAACRPAVVAGEQVASKDGRLWLAGVRADLEAVAYDLWASDICAAGIGAPHIRQRLWWLADSNSGRELRRPGEEGSAAPEGQAEVGIEDRERLWILPGGSGDVGRVADAYCGERDRQPDGEGCEFDGTATRRIEGDGQLERRGATSRMAHTDGGIAGHRDLQRGGQYGQQPQNGGPGGLGNAECLGREVALQQLGDGREAQINRPADVSGSAGASDRLGNTGGPGLALGSVTYDGRGFVWEQGTAFTTASPYRRTSVVFCTDGKARRFESGSFPLAHGVSNRVGRLRAYGNAINPWLAAEVLGAYLEGGCVA